MQVQIGLRILTPLIYISSLSWLMFSLLSLWGWITPLKEYWPKVLSFFQITCQQIADVSGCIVDVSFETGNTLFIISSTPITLDFEKNIFLFIFSRCFYLTYVSRKGRAPLNISRMCVKRDYTCQFLSLVAETSLQKAFHSKSTPSLLEEWKTRSFLSFWSKGKWLQRL